MSDKIKLKVAGNVDFEYISQGNHALAAVAAGDEVEVEDRRFADWLIREHGFTEISGSSKKKTPAVDNAAKGGNE